MGILAVAAYEDFLYAKIPNILIAIGTVIGIGIGIKENKISQHDWTVVGIGMILILLIISYVIGVFGAGDVKLLGMSTLYLFEWDYLYFLFFAMVTAVVFGLGKGIFCNEINKESMRIRFAICMLASEILRITWIIAKAVR